MLGRQFGQLFLVLVFFGKNDTVDFKAYVPGIIFSTKQLDQK